MRPINPAPLLPARPPVRIALQVIPWLALLLGACTHSTDEPSSSRLREFGRNLGVGSYVFNERAGINGSQSPVTYRFVYKVVAIRDDLLFMEPVLPVSGSEIDEERYKELLSIAGKAEIPALVVPGRDKEYGAQPYEAETAKLLADKPATRYLHRCNLFSLTVFSKTELLKNGTLMVYHHDWGPRLELHRHGYAEKITPATPEVRQYCPDFGDAWLPESLQGKPIVVSPASSF